jgi:hypothetical protein
MKILFLMDSPEYLRFYDSAIEELAARGHAVSIAVNHQSLKKPVVLGDLHAYLDRVTVAGLVPRNKSRWGRIAYGLRGTMDFVRYLHPRLAAAPALRMRMKRKVCPSAYQWLDAVPHLTPGLVRGLQRTLMAAERALPVGRDITEFLQAERPDVLLVSPLVDAASAQVEWIKGARALGIRTAACIASWDNLTNKGLLRIEPDLVVVWNEAQKREAQEFHYVPPEKVAVTGAQLFDKWFATTASRDREAFCRHVGLPDARPFVLFTGSSSFISESNAEVAFVKRWIAALRASGDPALQEVNVLVRPHPYNFHAWGTQPLASHPGVAVFPRSGYNPIDPGNRADFFDSLHHCAAVVGINTSAMIEAAIVGRPVCSILADEFAGTQEGTVHFHYLLPENGGCVRIASTLEEHVAQLRDRLRDPDASHAEARRFVSHFIRPHGLERPATPIFADAIERLAQMPAPAPQGAPWWGPLLRPLLLVAALPVPIVDWVRRPDRMAPMRKRAQKTGYRTRKSVGRAAALTSSRVRRSARTWGKRWQKAVVKPLRARMDERP